MKKTNTPASSPAINPEILEAALEGFEAQLDRLNIQIGLVRGLAGKKPVKKDAGEAPANTASTRAKHNNGPARPRPKRKKRNLSPEARKRIAEAQKRRWAAFRNNTDE